MRQLGVEQPLEPHEGDIGVTEVGVRDWMASVCEDLEGIMAEAIEAGNLIGEAGIEEEVLDQEALYGHMNGMVRIWEGIRSGIFFEPPADSLGNRFGTWPLSVDTSIISIDVSLLTGNSSLLFLKRLLLTLYALVRSKYHP